MEDIKTTSRDLVRKLNITSNKTEFVNDLNLYLDIIAFRKEDTLYCDIFKAEFQKYMGRWNLDLDTVYKEIFKFIKNNKLPFKIVKDEGIKNIKSDKFIISMLVELYAINITLNSDYMNKEKIINFILDEFKKNKLNINKRDVFIRDIDYIFKDEKIYKICKRRIKELKKELYSAYIEIKEEVEHRKNINLDLKLSTEENNNHTYIKKLENTINEYKNKQMELEKEIQDLKSKKDEILNIEEESMNIKIIEKLIKQMNDENNGNLMDRLYRYSKGYEEENVKILINNLFNVFRQTGIIPREVVKIGQNVKIEEYSFYDYRVNRDISDIKTCEGVVIYPAWFYKNKQIMKPYVSIRGKE